MGCRTLLLPPGGFGLGVMRPQPLPCGDRMGQTLMPVPRPGTRWDDPSHGPALSCRPLRATGIFNPCPFTPQGAVTDRSHPRELPWGQSQNRCEWHQYSGDLTPLNSLLKCCHEIGFRAALGWCFLGLCPPPHTSSGAARPSSNFGPSSSLLLTLERVSTQR